MSGDLQFKDYSQHRSVVRSLLSEVSTFYTLTI